MNHSRIFNMAEKKEYDSEQLIEYIKVLELKNNKIQENLNKLSDKHNKVCKELSESNLELEKVCKMRDHMFEAFESSQEKLAVATIAHEQTTSTLKNDMKALLCENSNLKKTIQTLNLKSERCRELEFQITDIQKHMESQYHQLIENSKSDAMDALYVIDDVEACIAKFRKDIEKTHDDIKIGSKTIQDIVIILEKDSEACLNKLLKIKEKFLKDNNIFNISK